MIDRLIQDHDRMRAQMARLRAMLAEPAPPTDVEMLMECRWSLAREVMQHLPREERLVYHPLADCGQPALIATGARFHGALAPMFDAFRAHVARWPTAAVIAEWPVYRVALGRVLDGLAERAEAEERDLYPLARTLDAAPSARQAEHRNWAADSWAIKDSIATL